jgi:AAHS family 4-hydroxybenzoate transporter-like MFS transporter
MQPRTAKSGDNMTFTPAAGYSQPARADSGIFDIQSWIDQRKVSGYQFFIAILCFLVVALDGVDTTVIGFVAPSLLAEWHLSGNQLSPVLGAGLFGLTLGALVSGPIGDRFGRKIILIACVTVFGIFSLLCAAMPNVEWLTLMRFLAGVGLGGAMPNAITLTSEYCPEGKRSLLVTTMFCGFTLGSAGVGILAAHIVPVYGWRTMLAIGGVMPLVLAPILLFLLPESARFMVHHKSPRERILAVLRRIDRRVDVGDRQFAMHEPAIKETRSPVRQLFVARYSFGTIALWLAFWMSLLIVYLLINWLPSLFHAAGFDLKRAALVTALFQVGGTVGGIAIGRAMDKLNPYAVLAAAYLSGVLFVFMVAFGFASPFWLALGVFGVGICVSGSQVGANALAAAFYPTSNRSTGVSWALGIGRTGSIVGSVVGGAMLSTNMGLSGVFSLLAIPTAIAGIAIAAMGWRYRRSIN